MPLSAPFKGMNPIKGNNVTDVPSQIYSISPIFLYIHHACRYKNILSQRLGSFPGTTLEGHSPSCFLAYFVLEFIGAWDLRPDIIRTIIRAIGGLRARS
jgi:hypothetical protein